MKSISRWIVFGETSSSAAIFWQFGKWRAFRAAWSRIIRSNGGRENPLCSFWSSGPVGRFGDALIVMAVSTSRAPQGRAYRRPENILEIFYHGTVDVLPPVLESRHEKIQNSLSATPSPRRSV